MPWLDAWLAFTAVTFPRGSFAAQQHAALGLIPSAGSPSLPVLAPQLYEAVALVALYIVVTPAERKQTHRDGTVVFATVSAWAPLTAAAITDVSPTRAYLPGAAPGDGILLS